MLFLYLKIFMKRFLAILSLLLSFLTVLIIFHGCQKPFIIDVVNNGGATGSLKDNSGNCIPDSISGTFYDGVTPGSDTAFILVKVNVSKAGHYTITTDTQNGFYFFDSGYFSNTGINAIKLKPVGTPAILQETGFNITFDTSVCSFTVNVIDSTGLTNPNLSHTAWKFKGPAGAYNGSIDTAYSFDTLGVTYLYLRGQTQATGDSSFQMSIDFLGGAIATGTYNTSSNAVFKFTNMSIGAVIYLADPTVHGVSVSITITGYDPSTKILTGTFTGTAGDSSRNAAYT